MVQLERLCVVLGLIACSMESTCEPFNTGEISKQTSGVKRGTNNVSQTTAAFATTMIKKTNTDQIFKTSALINATSSAGTEYAIQQNFGSNSTDSNCPSRSYSLGVNCDSFNSGQTQRSFVILLIILGGIAGLVHFKFFEKPLEDIVIFRQDTIPGVSADLCHAPNEADSVLDNGENDSSQTSDVGDEADDPCFEKSTMYSKGTSMCTLLATFFSKATFIYLFVSKGKTEAFAFVLDIVVFAYSVYKRPRYVPCSNIFNSGYELFWKIRLAKKYTCISGSFSGFEKFFVGFTGYSNVIGVSESISLLLCSVPCWSSLSMVHQFKVCIAIISVLIVLPSILPCCCASLYFYGWSFHQAFRFYWAMLRQREIRNAHDDFEAQEHIRATGGDGRNFLQRLAGNFSNSYSAENVNARNYQQAAVRAEAADRIAGAQCLGYWVPDLSSRADRDPMGFYRWANFWVSI